MFTSRKIALTSGVESCSFTFPGPKRLAKDGYMDFMKGRDERSDMLNDLANSIRKGIECARKSTNIGCGG